MRTVAAELQLRYARTMQPEPYTKFIHRPRLREFDYHGHHAYHITMTTRSREAILREALASDVVAALKETAARTSFEILVYCIMPDHIHALLHGTVDHADLIGFVRRFKQVTSFRYKQATDSLLWQPSFFDRVIRTSDEMSETARYIVRNPVEAGLIGDAEEWPFRGGSLLSERS